MTIEEYKELSEKLYCYPIDLKENDYLNFFYSEEGIDQSFYQDIEEITKKMFYPDIAAFAKKNGLTLFVMVIKANEYGVERCDKEEVNINHYFYEQGLLIPEEPLLKIGEYIQLTYRMLDEEED